MYKETRTGECRRVNGHASFLCIRISARVTLYGLLMIVILCAGVMCGCGKKNDAVYIAAEENSDNTEAVDVTGEDITVSSGNDNETEVFDGDLTQTDESVQLDVLLYVYVCGAVESPGLYALEDGSRVYDAIAAAGGLATGACPDYWNQAAYVSDGQMIDVPTQTEVDEGLVSQSSGSGSASGSALDSGTTESSSGSGSDSGTTDPDGSGNTDGTSGSGKVNINTATQEELMTLSGIGEVRASAIISYREEHGSFSSIEDIKNVSGIGDALYDKICGDIAVD